MFIKKTNIKLLAAALLTALAAPSCLNLDETQEGGFGYLTISGLDLDVQVEQLVPTKAESVTLNSLGIDAAPVEANAVFTLVKDGESQTVQPNTELKLQAGTYTLNITYNNQGADGFGEALFGNASYPVTITAGQNTPLEYSLPLANSVMLVINDMGDHVDSSKPITISSSEVSGEVEAAFGSYVFVPSGKSLVVSGTNAAEAVFSYNLGPLDGGKAYNVKLTPSGLPELELSGTQMLLGTTLIILSPATISSGSANPESIVYEATTDTEWNTANKKISTVQDGVHIIEGLTAGVNYKVRARIGAITSEPVEITPISVSAEHSYTNGSLDGTDLKISNVPDNLKNQITFTLKNGETTYRSGVKESGDIDSDGSSITDSNGWPYLPAGESYYLTASVEINDKTVTSHATITVNHPTFTVNTGAYTSYSKYLSGAVSDANGCAAETIYNLQSVTPGISSGLLSNTKYSKSYSVSLNKNIINSKNAEGQSWGSHTVESSYTFAGTTCTGTTTLHITGLPYNISFYENITPSGWSLNNNGSSYSRLVLKRGEAYAITPSFWVPGVLNVQAILSAYAYRGSVGDYKPTVSIHASESGVNSTVNATLSGTSQLPYTATYTDIKSDIALTSEVKRICIYTSGKGSNWSVGSGDMGVVCQSFAISYRE